RPARSVHLHPCGGPSQREFPRFPHVPRRAGRTRPPGYRSRPMPGLDATTAAEALSPAERRRGRRLAVLSHPAGMTHRTLYTEQLPTLALVGLGASEALVGLQRAFEPASQLLQLVALRAVGRVRKRTILVTGQAVAVAAG